MLGLNVGIVHKYRMEIE